MKRPYHVHLIPCYTYKIPIYLIHPKEKETVLDDSHIASFLMSKGVRDYVADNKNFAGRCVAHYDGQKYPLIILCIAEKWDGSPGALSILAHEAFHCVETLLENRVKHGNETTEAWAYLIEWLMFSCSTYLQKTL